MACVRVSVYRSHVCFFFLLIMPQRCMHAHARSVRTTRINYTYNIHLRANCSAHTQLVLTTWSNVYNKNNFFGVLHGRWFCMSKNGRNIVGDENCMWRQAHVVASFRLCYCETHPPFPVAHTFLIYHSHWLVARRLFAAAFNYLHCICLLGLKYTSDNCHSSDFRMHQWWALSTYQFASPATAIRYSTLFAFNALASCNHRIKA